MLLLKFCFYNFFLSILPVSKYLSTHLCNDDLLQFNISDTFLMLLNFKYSLTADIVSVNKIGIRKYGWKNHKLYKINILKLMIEILLYI